jgi:hypothetical protein
MTKRFHGRGTARGMALREQCVAVDRPDRCAATRWVLGRDDRESGFECRQNPNRAPEVFLITKSGRIRHGILQNCRGTATDRPRFGGT